MPTTESGKPTIKSGMSTTDSDLAAQTGRHEIGIGGRHPPERVDGMNRNGWSA
jgi:hypothetical protein